MNLLKRMHAILQIRTGFVAVATSMVGLAYSISIGLEVRWFIMFLFFTAAFAVNIVTNIANGIVGATREDNLHTINDSYKGKNGLVTGVTTHRDAYIALALFTGYTIGAGMLIVLLTKSLIFFGIGIVSVFIALIYSFGPKPLTDYPVTELISGFFCGTLPTVLVVYFNGGAIGLRVIGLGLVSLILVGQLMLTNNMCDIEKDRNHRKTLAHLVEPKQFMWMYLFINMSAGIIAMFAIPDVQVGFVFWITSGLYFNRLYLFKVKNLGMDFSGNKGIYIPLYLQYYYQVIAALCICLFL